MSQPSPATPLSWVRVMETLNQVVTIMHQNINQLLDRGLTVDDLEVRSHDLVNTSELFVIRVLPWYKRIYYRFTRCICIPVHALDRCLCCYRHPWKCCRRRHQPRVRIRRVHSV